MTAHTLFVCNGGSVIFTLPIERTETTVLNRPSHDHVSFGELYGRLDY